MTVLIVASKKVGPGKATSRCRTSLSRHPDAEMQRARLQPLTTSLSDLVAYGEVSYSGRVRAIGTAGTEITALLAELRELSWVPATRNDVGA